MTNSTNANNSSKPDFVIKASTGFGRNSKLATIGVAWSREDGFYCRLYGRQIVEDGFYVFPMLEERDEPTPSDERAAIRH